VRGRGDEAAHATLVENAPAALPALRANVTELGLAATVVDSDAGRYLAGPVSPYDLVLVDPPYELEVDPVLAGLRPWLTGGGVLVVERRTRGPAPAVPEGFVAERDRRYGEATLWYFSAL
jgi:16S rRNA (guanine966-N2)-methyltransferase